jgi:hypothetical protein
MTKKRILGCLRVTPGVRVLVGDEELANARNAKNA